MKKSLSAFLVLLIILAALPAVTGGWNAPAMAAAPAITRIAAGCYHSLALLSDGSLYAWGSNEFGQLGDGTSTNRKTPVKIGTGYTAIAAGEYHSLALKGNILYAWGYNYNGQLGDGKNTCRYAPARIGTGYTAIAAGKYHSLALKGKALYAWGYNYNGQLGDGTVINRNTPALIGTGYTAIAAGLRHSLALKGNALYAWGYNISGQLGDGTYISKSRPAQIGTGYTAIAAGDLHSLALKGSALYAWGYNFSGQLGDGTNINKNKPVQIGTGYTAIAAGNYHSLAFKGSFLYAWGSNYSGQLGIGSNINNNTPALIGIGYTAAAAGYRHSLALKGDSLYACGRNGEGQLGNGTNTDRQIPILVKLSAASPDPTSVILNKVKIEMTIGKSLTLKTTVIPSNANQQVTWSSSNPSVASVSSNGLITAKKKGTTVITAKSSNSKSATCTVTVTNAARRALLIGQINYLSGKLNGPENDLAVMKSVLERSGYADITICKNLTAYGIKEALWDLSYNGGTKDDVTFLYYSGHGMESSTIANRGAFMGVDENFIPIDEIRIILDYVPGTVIAVFDSCLSGQFIQSRAPNRADKPPDPDAFNTAVISAFSSEAAQSRSLTDHASSSKYRILTAAEPLQSSYSFTLANNKYIGLMTYYFARGAGIDAVSGIVSADADANKDKVISLNEMYAYIKNNVKNVYLGGKSQNVQVWPAQSNYAILTVP